MFNFFQSKAKQSKAKQSVTLIMLLSAGAFTAAAQTPVCEVKDNRLYMHGGNEIVWGYDAATGRAPWLVEYHNKGLNFWQNSPYADYRLFLKDNGSVCVNTEDETTGGKDAQFKINSAGKRSGLGIYFAPTGAWSGAGLDIMTTRTDVAAIEVRNTSGHGGYFVTGDGQTYGSGSYTYSDSTLKENIQPVKSVLARAKQLKAYTYNYKGAATPASTLKSDKAKTAAQAGPAAQQHIGFMAQQVQRLFPEAVSTTPDGSLAVAYDELIPVLFEAMAEQQDESEALKKENQKLQASLAALNSRLARIEANCCPASNKLKSDNSTTSNAPASAQPALYQNAPNPFGQETKIGMDIPAAVASARLCIYDLAGRELRCIEVAERGATSVILAARDLAPGLYHYALLADGQLVDTKTMAVTE